MTAIVAAPRIPDTVLAEMSTPSLVIDIPTARRNIETAASILRARGMSIRPHFKAHKCVPLLELQLQAAGTIGATCATGAEAEVLAVNGVADVLIANELVDRRALQQLVAAAARARVTVAVDSLVHVAALREVVPEPLVVQVVIEIDSGYHRCGVAPDDPVVADLAAAVAAAPNLGLAGIMGYEGHAVLEEDLELRSRLVAEAARSMTTARQLLAARGFACEVVSGGGTGTLGLWPEGGPLTEVQAGSYVVMDATYGRLALPFQNGLFALSTVISRSGERGVGDAGMKSISREYGFPTFVGDGTVTGLADEHVLFTVGGGSSPAIGERIWLVPAHIDPTMNLHARVYAWDPSAGLEEWNISRDR